MMRAAFFLVYLAASISSWALDLTEYGLNLRWSYTSGPCAIRMERGRTYFWMFINGFRQEATEKNFTRAGLMEIDLILKPENCRNVITDFLHDDVSMNGLTKIHVGHKSYRKAMELIGRIDRNIAEINTLVETIRSRYNIRVKLRSTPFVFPSSWTPVSSPEDYLFFLNNFYSLLETKGFSFFGDEPLYVEVQEQDWNILASDICIDCEEGKIVVGHRSFGELVEYLSLDRALQNFL